MAKREASWEIDSKASFPQAPYDSTTNGTQTQASSSHLASFDQCFLCSVVRAAAPVVTQQVQLPNKYNTDTLLINLMNLPPYNANTSNQHTVPLTQGKVPNIGF